MKKNTLVKKFEEVIEQIELLTWENGIEAFHITRTALKTGIKEIEAYALKMELEDDLVILSDMQNTLRNNDLSLLILDDIKEVRVTKDKDNHNLVKFDIIMTNKYLTIESLPDVHMPDDIYEAA